jgi:hypothetical protein
MLGWAGLIISRAMCGLLRTSPFRIPTDPGPLAIYYPPHVAFVDTQGDPVLDGQGMPTYQPNQPLVEQNRLPLMLVSSVQKNIASRIKIYDVQYSTASTMESTMYSRYQTIPPLPDGIRQWNQGKCLTK